MNCPSCKYFMPDGATLCGHCGKDLSKTAILWKGFSLLISLSTLAMAGAILWQSCSLHKQTNIIKSSFELENRPYLYVDIVPLAFSNREKEPSNGEEYDNLYVGAELTYKNVGELPACNIKSEIHFYSDVDTGDNYERLKKWYIEEFGYFPEPTTVFPQQEGQKIVCKVDCGESTKDYLFTIRISYTGENPSKLYWYTTDVRYSIEKGRYKQRHQLIKEGDKIIEVPGLKEYSVYFINAVSDYDRDGKANIPLPLSRADLLKKVTSAKR